MSAANLARQLTNYVKDTNLDPGDAGSILVGTAIEHYDIITAAAETRTLAAPAVSGLRVTLALKTDGGNATVTVTGGYNQDADTTLTFSDVGDSAVLESLDDNGTIRWELLHYVSGSVLQMASLGIDGTAVTATAAELNQNDNSVQTIAAGSGWSDAQTHAVGVLRNGDLFISRFVVDLTDLVGSATDLDIIGNTGGAANAHIGTLTAALAGTTIVGGLMTCLEVPAGGADDIDLYSATEATGAQDALITSLTETALVTSGAAWTSGRSLGFTAVPGSTETLYLVNGEAVGGTYTAGKFLIELYGVA